MPNIRQYEPLWGLWYVDGEPIGEGAFWTVYKVHKEEFGYVYYAAVKVMSIPQEGDIQRAFDEGIDARHTKMYFTKFVRDIAQEIELMSAFKGNSNIASIEDHAIIEHSNGIGWDILIRMELLIGLQEYACNNPMSPRDVVKLGIDISKALEICASKKIIHLNINPNNILVSRLGDFKLDSFRTSHTIGHTLSFSRTLKRSYMYMAPEMIRGESCEQSADIYSLGIIMYKYLNNNRPPFFPPYPEPITPQDKNNSIDRRINGEPIPAIPSIDPKLNTIVLKACAFNPQDRFSDATSFRIALEEYSKHNPTESSLIKRWWHKLIHR